MHRHHVMPFGAEARGDGTVRFRLWAPAARRVDLCLEREGNEQVMPMPQSAPGWFALESGEASVGARYRYRIDGGQRVPDPASRYQPRDVHGPSEVVDPLAWTWTDTDWRGRPWEEVVFLELHVGTFTPEGTFAAAIARLDHVAGLGVTAIELMPVADFPGTRNWGYDGVLPYAPEAGYGRPEDLKRLVQSAHERGLMVFLDVVYNHFGPEGNYLHLYAPQFFTERHHTPWGAAINFDGDGSATVRDFYIHNALYWLEEFHLDGLRLDAAHAILDDSEPDFLTDLARAVAAGPGMIRPRHLALENDHNAARYLAATGHELRGRYAAQWNDDIHHALHVLVTGETAGCYADYADRPAAHLGRCLAEGFAYQGEPSAFRHGARRGESTQGVSLGAFVSFLQTHDQIGNRALGERIEALAPEAAVRAATAIVLLAPSPPMLFMGEEWGSSQPFPFFCEFGPELAAAVAEGRLREFAAFPQFRDPAARAAIPDPNSVATFQSAKLDWTQPDSAHGRAWIEFHRELLALRAIEIAPRLPDLPLGAASYRLLAERALRVEWRMGDQSRLTLLANLGEHSVAVAATPGGRCLYAISGDSAGAGTWAGERLRPWAVVWTLDEVVPGPGAGR